MVLLSRKRIVTAAIESTYGVDAAPTGANAILVRNLTITPQDSDFAPRDLVRPYFGQSEQLPAAIRAKLEFEVEMAGAGTAGTAPGYGVLLRACGFSQTLNASALTGTAQTGSTSTTIKLAAGASSTDDAYAGMPISLTAGTGSGQSGYVVDYVGSTKVATVATAWSVTPDATTQYSIGACAAYQPVSAGFESVSMYFNVDGVLHKLTGARGTVALSLKAKEIPTIKFTFTGIYNAVTDTAAVTPVYTAFQTPQVVNNVNTPAFSLHGYSAVMSEFTADLGNSIVHRTLVGSAESVLLTDRKGTGQITVEATTVAAKDWWTLAKNATLGAFVVQHGTSAGNKFALVSGRVQLTGPIYADMDGVQMLQMNHNLIPSTAGNDELLISVF